MNYTARCEAVTQGGYQCTRRAVTTAGLLLVCRSHALMYDEYLQEGDAGAAYDRLTRLEDYPDPIR